MVNKVEKLKRTEKKEKYDLTNHQTFRFESSKSHKRHLHDSRFARQYFVGQGIDVGSGYDTLEYYRPLFPLITHVKNWEMEDGDAQYLSTIPDNSMDFLFASHCIEHVQHPYIAVYHWFRVIKPGGHMIVVAPDEDMYEQGIFCSRKNPDHKWTFTINKKESWSGVSINITDLIESLGSKAHLLKIESLDSGYHYIAPPHDQTAHYAAECAIEFIVRKYQPHESKVKGKMPLDRHYKNDKVKYYQHPTDYNFTQLPTHVRNPKKDK